MYKPCVLRRIFVKNKKFWIALIVLLLTVVLLPGSVLGANFDPGDDEKANEMEAEIERLEEEQAKLEKEQAELEKQLEWVRDKNDEWAAVAQGLRNTIEEMKAQKEVDDKKSEEICAACNEQYERVLSERNHLREEVARLTNERDTAVNENTVMTFDLNELRDKWEVERNLRTEYEQKLEVELDKTTHWYTKYQQLSEEYNELEANFDELERVHKLWGEEIDRLRRVVTELQTNRFTTDEFIGMIMKNFVPSADK
jgi:chromosome segregation ATPase